MTKAVFTKLIIGVAAILTTLALSFTVLTSAYASSEEASCSPPFEDPDAPDVFIVRCGEDMICEVSKETGAVLVCTDESGKVLSPGSSGPESANESLNPESVTNQPYETAWGASLEKPAGWCYALDNDTPELVFYPTKENDTACDEAVLIGVTKKPASFNGANGDAANYFLDFAKGDFADFTIEKIASAEEGWPAMVVYTYSDPNLGPSKVLQAIVPADDGPFWLVYRASPEEFETYANTALEAFNSFRNTND